MEELRSWRAVQPAYYLRLGCAAMACRFEIWLKPGASGAISAARAAFDEVRAIEARFSIFIEGSELRRINSAAHAETIPVADDLFDLLLLARRIARLSDGALDITSGALSRCWGLLDRKARVPDDDELATARRSRGWERVRLDTQARTIAFDAPGIELNLGSLGKGYALDRCASRLQDAGILDFLIQAGGSTILARGHAADGLGWPITLPRAGSARREVLLLDEALSTSGSSEQTYMLNGQHLGHIIDPREGRPSERTGVVSAIARSGALAEAVSTALFLMDDASASRLLSATGARRCA